MEVNRKIHNIAHKGASKKYPGNTLLAFEKALEMGADMLEVDLRLSKDNHVVVIHDSEIFLEHSGKTAISDLSFTEIKKIQLDQNQRIPGFSELIKMFKNRCKFYLDLKDEKALDPVIEILKRECSVSSAVVGSNNPSLLQKSKLIEKNLKTSLLISLKDRDIIFKLAENAASDFLHPCWEKYSGSPSSLLTEKFFEKAEKENYNIVIWHEEREDELKKLCKKPVYGICTDEPDILNKIIKNSLSAY